MKMANLNKYIIFLILFFIFTGGFYSATGSQSIPEPDVTYYGIAKFRGYLSPDQQVRLVDKETNGLLSNTTTMADASKGYNYLIKLKMDAIKSIEGRDALFYINDDKVGETKIPKSGSVVKLDLDTMVDNDSDGDNMDDSWEMKHFKSLDRDGTGDLNRNGITDLDEFLNGKDPASPSWLNVDENTVGACVFHPLVFQKALEESQADSKNNIIKLASGTYAGNFTYTAASGENFGLTITGGFSDDCSGEIESPELTIIDGNSSGRVLSLDTASNNTTGKIEIGRLSVKNGKADGNGGGIYVNSVSGKTEIQRCKVFENSAVKGGGIFIETFTGEILVSNCLVLDNTGEGLSADIKGESPFALIANNTVSKNTGGGIYLAGISETVSPKLINNIISDNGDYGIKGSLKAGPDFDFNLVYKNSQGNYENQSFKGENDINEDPLFVNTSENKFELSSASPAIDGGKNIFSGAVDNYKGGKRTKDGNNDNIFITDIGAFEFEGADPSDGCNLLNDKDCDGVSDENDKCNGSDDKLDDDGDSIPNGCDRCPSIDDNQDIDNDKMSDCWEESNGLNPLVNDADLDNDNDGFSNIQEFNRGSEPDDINSSPVNNPPGIPSLYQPLNGAEVKTASPELKLNNSEDDDLLTPSYIFEVYKEGYLDSPVIVSEKVNGNISGITSWTISSKLEENKKYIWRAKAVGAEDGESGWTEFFTFMVNVVNDSPSAPSRNSPLNGEEVVIKEPYLEVNYSTDPDSANIFYEFEIDESELFNTSSNEKSPSIVQGSENTIRWKTSVLKENTRYFWRARSCDGKICSQWTDTGNFFINIQNDLPLAPSLKSPLNGAELKDKKPVLRVFNSSDPDGDPLKYEFEVYRDVNMNSLVSGAVDIAEGNGETSWQPVSELEYNSVYWWRARARDDKGAAGNWTTLFKFIVKEENYPPSKPSMVSPLSGAEVKGAKPALIIKNSTDANGDKVTYFIDIDTEDDFTGPALQRSPELSGGPDGTTIWSPSGLIDNTKYFWRCIAFDGKAYSEWENGEFLVNYENDIPLKAVVKSPGTGSEVNLLRPVLSVEAEDSDDDILSYEFEIYSNEEGTELIASKKGASDKWEPESDLKDNTKYYWRGRGVDPHGGKGEWSDLSWFFVNTANESPDAPLLNNPVSGGIVVSRKPVLSVYNSTDPEGSAIKYEFEVYSDKGLTGLVTSKTVSQGDAITSFNIESELEDNKFYYWRVRAGDGENLSSWMDTAVFRVAVYSVETTSKTVASKLFSSASSDLQFIEVQDEKSSIYRLRLEIKPGILKKDMNIRISEVLNPPALPSNGISIGGVVRFEPAGAEFSSNIQLKVPYTDEDLAKAGVEKPEDLDFMYYNTAELKWEDIPVASVDKENRYLVVDINHFSIFTTCRLSSGVSEKNCFIESLADGGSWSVDTFLSYLSAMGFILFLCLIFFKEEDSLN